MLNDDIPHVHNETCKTFSLAGLALVQLEMRIVKAVSLYGTEGVPADLSREFEAKCLEIASQFRMAATAAEQHR